MPGRRNDACVRLAEEEKWGEVYLLIDRGEAGIDDYADVDVRARSSRSRCNPPAAPHRPGRGHRCPLPTPPLACLAVAG